MYLGKVDVNTYEKGAGREFLVSNGLGSYGFSTVIGANTRREHGLLVVRPTGEVRHSVLVSKVEETVLSNGKKYQLSTNRYKDLVYPDGFRYIQEYKGNPFPNMLFVIHGTFIKKSIFMPQGETCTVIRYEAVSAPQKIQLELRPLFAHRLNSEIRSEYKQNDFTVATSGGQTIKAEGCGLSSFCTATKGKWEIKPLWFENVMYEQDDVQNASGDSLWAPGTLTLEMNEGDVAFMVLSGEKQDYTPEQLEEFFRKETERYSELLEKASFEPSNTAACDMIVAAYHLIDNKEDKPAKIYSGYPSTERRSRDTFVALPGLALATGRADIVESALHDWLKKCRENDTVMPERIAEDGQLATAGADNGLWFVYAAEKYLKGTKDAEIAKGVMDITDRYMQGIEVLDLTFEKGAFLSINSENPARHWMNSVVSGKNVVTRKGCLVELNALWYNALRTAEKCAAELGDSAAEKKYAETADKFKAEFEKMFWDNAHGCLCDWILADGSEKSSSVRPNQILAASLPYTALSEEAVKKVIRVCWDALYTTYGLRTLDPKDDKFKGRAEGSEETLNKARYRGTAWTWLLGQFITAYTKAYPENKRVAWMFIRPFSSHLRHGGLGCIAEFFDGTMPYKPHGDVLNAMAHGEMLRVLYENLESK